MSHAIATPHRLSAIHSKAPLRVIDWQLSVSIKSSSRIGESVPVLIAGIFKPFLKMFQRAVPSEVGFTVYERIVAEEVLNAVESGIFVGLVEVPPVGAVERLESDQL